MIAEQLIAVHREMKRRLDATPDQLQYLVPDYWATFQELQEQIRKSGWRFKDDCDGAAAFCRGRLTELKIPSRYVLCLTETGDWHLVVEHGGWVLDNRFDSIMRRQDLEKIGYKFVSMSGFNKGDPWHLVV